LSRAINLRSFPINYTLFVTSLCKYTNLFKAESKIWIFLFIKESSLNLIDLKIVKRLLLGES
ncbi:hypothetical protein, partial [Bacteroides intestinalis]|uniref:hypothetical protein n=1 Tax=Bacteroides intestinalis TaxID=329854 RepID=UPI001C7035F8